MLLLKGNQGKSLIVDAMMSRGRVCTIAYIDFPSPIYGDDSWIIDSREYNVSQLIEGIEGINNEYNDRYLMFLIIYTNEAQEDLIDLLQWIEDNERSLNCSSVLVTCK